MLRQLFASIVERFLIWGLVFEQLRLMNRRPHQRGQHPKQHGCVWADFEIAVDLPADIKMGVFARPHRYDALIRFSNGSAADDRKPDVHGMAIKLVDVPGEKLLGEEREGTTQDFVLADWPVFFARNIWHLLQFTRVTAAQKEDGTVYEKFPAFRGFLHEVTSSPLTYEYWSETPYKLGATIVRYSVKPDPGNATTDEDRSSPDFLRKAMANRLAPGMSAAAFDFYIQRAPDDSQKWIDDPTVHWDEEASPPVKVGRLTIAPQAFANAERDAYGDRLAFTPWHCLPVHEPVGQINRARRAAYRASAKRRGSSHREPTSSDRPREG